MDLRDALGAPVVHRRVKQQQLITKSWQDTVIDCLPTFPARRGVFKHGLAIVDWDHHLPSRILILRLLGFYDDETFEMTHKLIQKVENEIHRQDRFPEFDTLDYEIVDADEHYRCEILPNGSIQHCQLTSTWRNDLGGNLRDRATDAVRDHKLYRAQVKELESGHPLIGHLSAVGWTPPCETGLDEWVVDVWLTTDFSGAFLSGTRFFFEPTQGSIVSTSPFEAQVP